MSAPQKIKRPPPTTQKQQAQAPQHAEHAAKRSAALGVPRSLYKAAPVTKAPATAVPAKKAPAKKRR